MAREPKTNPKRRSWRGVVGLAVLGLASASAALATLKVCRFVTTDPQFALSPDRQDAVTIEGLRYGSRTKVLRVFSADFGRSIFMTPLDERRRRLLNVDWVEDASISRIWPDRLDVHIRERTPIAFVLLRSGVQLIDSQGVMLELPAQAQFTFPVLSGIREQDTPNRRLERVSAFLRVEQELGDQAKDLSEVNAADPADIHVVAQMGDRTVELLLGDADFGRRYQNFLTHYPEIRKQSPEGKRFDLRLEDRITATE